eukprot:55265-Prorocentrum_minimum.AAC.4
MLLMIRRRGAGGGASRPWQVVANRSHRTARSKDTERYVIMVTTFVNFTSLLVAVSHSRLYLP